MSGRAAVSWRCVVAAVVGVSVLGAGRGALGEELIRVATYNIKFFEAPESDWTVSERADHVARLESLEEVIEALDADVIALQEIDDRAALRQVLPESEWSIVIDDESGDDQDVALAARRDRLGIVGHGGAADVDADDTDFLFPGSVNNFHFPNRRDVLAVELEVEGTGRTFHVFVIHALSRFSGRATSEARRVGAARELVVALEQGYDGEGCVVLGDFNDNPDDRSLNVLETGDPNAPGGAEDEPGVFLVNLCEPLAAEGHVSHGLNSRDIDREREVVDTVDPESRERNNRFRGEDVNTGDILFDQILISPALAGSYVADSAMVFDHPACVRGNSRTRASDHMPVVAEFVFAEEDGGGAVAGVRIVGVLPNPVGRDRGNERVMLVSDSGERVDGWFLMDRAETRFDLSGNLPAGVEVEVVLDPATMMLNNGGDEVELYDASGRLVDSFVYERGRVVEGGVIR